MFFAENVAYATICGSYVVHVGLSQKEEQYSPDAKTVSQHLSTHTGQNVTINSRDYICSTCYKAHCLIINSVRSPQGSDASFKQAIDQWVDKHSGGHKNK